MQGKFFDFRNFAVRTENKKIVFVTSETYNGALGGLAGADAICQERADDAMLPGTFKAWLSSSTTSVSQRFDRDYDDALFVHTDGVRVANDWADLTDGTLLAAINRDEFGLIAQGSTDRVWTNTKRDGTGRGADDCNGWTSDSSTGTVYSTIGTVSATNPLWTDTSGIYVCNFRMGLFCFRQQQVSFWSEAEQPLPQFPTHRTTHTSYTGKMPPVHRY